MENGQFGECKRILVWNQMTNQCSNINHCNGNDEFNIKRVSWLKNRLMYCRRRGCCCCCYDDWAIYIQPHASTTILGSVFRVAVELFSM